MPGPWPWVGLPVYWGNAWGRGQTGGLEKYFGYLLQQVRVGESTAEGRAEEVGSETS